MFEQFWSMYPRKLDKKKARIAFERLTPAQKIAVMNALPNHLKYWPATNTEIQFIPYPASWLNGERWEDELELPEVKAPKEQAWWTSEQGMIQKGRELGTEPQPGESWDKFKVRLTSKMRNSR